MGAVKRALVLSAGGCFGAYQAGALRALEEADWRPDLIVGASIGAMNAFVLAHGGTSADLARIWRNPPADIVEPELSIRKSLEGFKTWLRSTYLEFSERPQSVALKVALTEFPSLNIKVIDGEALTLPHLIASCAVPLLVRPVRLGNRLYVDGGAIVSLPLRQALDAGASEIVTIHLLAEPPSKIVWGARQAGAILRDWFHPEPAQLDDERLAGVRLIRIQHHERLGTLTECFSWRRERVEHWIETGYRDALAGASELNAAASNSQ